MENLQTEVLEIEFNEFSHGFKTISDLDFAEVLLRYTDFDRDTKKAILKKVKRTTEQPDVRLKQKHGTHYNSYKLLFHFFFKSRASHLNSLNISFPFLTILKNSILLCVFISYRINLFHKVNKIWF